MRHKKARFRLLILFIVFYFAIVICIYLYEIRNYKETLKISSQGIYSIFESDIQYMDRVAEAFSQEIVWMKHGNEDFSNEDFTMISKDYIFRNPNVLSIVYTDEYGKDYMQVLDRHQTGDYHEMELSDFKGMFKDNSKEIGADFEVAVGEFDEEYFLSFKHPIEFQKNSLGSAIVTFELENILNDKRISSSFPGLHMDVLIDEKETIKPHSHTGEFFRKTILSSKSIMGIDFDLKLRKEEGILFTILFKSIGILLAMIFIFFVEHRFDKKSFESEKRIKEVQSLRYKAEKLAFYDELTGLPNRRKTSAYINEQIGKSEKPFAVVFIDVDNFKEINDNMGHEQGDETLKKISDVLKEVTSKNIFASRLGGDEFVLCLTEIESKGQVKNICEEIMLAVKHKLSSLEFEHRITLSMGAGLYPEDGRSLKELFKKADKAMYNAKAKGKDGFSWL